MAGLVVYPGSGYCLECRCIFPVSEMVGNYCETCTSRRSARIKRELEMSDQRAIAKTARTLMERIQELGSDKQSLSSMFDEFTELNGGPKGMAKMLHEDFQKARGVFGNPESDEALAFSRNDNTIANYWKNIFTIMDKLEERNKMDLSGLTEEELQATVLGVAIDEAKANPEFCGMLIRAMAQCSIKVEAAATPTAKPKKTIDLEPDPGWEDEHDDE